MRRSCLAFAFALAVVWGVGCSSEPKAAAVPMAQVKGTVTMDGKPVPSGEAVFSVTGAIPQVLAIKDGAFAGEAPVGKNLVEINILVDGPPSEKYKGVGTKTNVAPEKYWGTNSVLSAEVAAGAANEFKFELSSK